jgi:hypothetical protein
MNLWKCLPQDESPPSWEWIIGYTIDVPGKSAWARIVQLANDTPNISLLHLTEKKGATLATYLSGCVKEAIGDYLLFLPHGTVPNIKLFSWLTEYSEEVDFLYGDFAFLDRKKGTPRINHTLPEKYWSTYQYVHEDAKCMVYKAAPLKARTLYEYKLAPTRAMLWERKIFNTMGGFNLQLQTGFEYEYTCRTYISGRKMVHIPDMPISFSEYHDLTEEQTTLYAGIGHKYFFPLIEQETKREGLEKYSLFNAPQTLQEDHKAMSWTGGELINENGNQIKDGTIGIINAADFLNFVPQAQVIHLVEDIWRVLAPNGWFISATPSSRGAGAFADPRQASYWNNLSFSFFCLTKDIDLGFKGLFQHTRVWESFPTDWHKQNGVAYVQANLMKLELPTPKE